MDHANYGTAELRADETNMSGQVEFFYDYVSIYSYLADSQLENLSGAEIVYRPMFLGGVMEATGNRPPGTVEAKRNYMLTDIERWAKRYSLPLKMNPLFPQNTLKALRLALVAQHQGVFDRVHQPLFEAMWVYEKDLSNEDVLAEIAAKPALSLAAIEDQAIKDELKANTEEAVARGVFGAPTFFVGEQMFFGNDRFEFIEKEIRNRGL
jgi:2-hydroxychromene-2-carboxylate isomerase